VDTNAEANTVCVERRNMKGIIGKKVGMTQLYDEKGCIIPVTVLEAGPCVVLDVKTVTPPFNWVWE
jgi:hypothetical protein